MLNLPTQLTSGDDWIIKIAPFSSGVISYDVTTHTLALLIRGPETMDMASTIEDQAFKFVATQAQTAALIAGVYQMALVGTAIATGERTTIQTCPLKILADPAATGAILDPRSEAQKMYDLITQVITALLNNEGVSEFQILGRQAKYYSLDELRRLQNQYAREIHRSNQVKSGKRGYRTHARFIRG